MTKLENTYQIYDIKNNSKFLVQNKLGKGLSSVFYKHKKNFKKIDILKLGIQMLKSIEPFHKLGYVHTDIKPNNILIDLDKEIRGFDSQVIDANFEHREDDQRNRLGQNSNHVYHKYRWIPSNLYLIDFGTSYKYTTNNNLGKEEHLANITGQKFYLNPMFASKHTILGNQSSRRDDIIQIVYNLIYLLNPPNCWLYRFDHTTDPAEEMRKFKESATPKEICEGERGECLIELCKEAYSYEYEDMPRYGVLKFLLEKELMKLNVIPDKYYSFF